MSNESPRIYNLSLLCAFTANVFQLVSVSLLFRYADFVTNIGGDEWHLGWIVGISAVGAILSRIIQGSAIDRFGAEWVWYLCIACQITGIAWHLQIESANSVSVYLARILYASGLAGTFGAWLSFVSLQAPAGRVAEVIGVVGSSGFVGMACGPVLGDLIFQSGRSLTDNVNLMFQCSAFAVSVSLLFAIGASRLGKSRHDANSNAARSVNAKNPFRTIASAKPGFVLVLGALMGMTIGLPGTFLRPFAASLEIDRINIFFVVYNVTAFTSRLIFRKAPQQLGLKRTICLGYFLMMVSMILYLNVNSYNALIWPALVGGLAHCFLFPSIVALCTEYFSTANRGVATNLILAMYDFGSLVGMPLVGMILTQSRAWGLAPYGTTFICMAAIIGLTLSLYVIVDSRKESQ